MEKGLYHIIFISFKPESPEEVREEVYRRYQRLADEVGGREAGILFWKIEKNLDLRKGVHLIEFAVFKDHETLEKFKNHPKHREIVDILIRHADWHAGDFYHKP